MQVFLRNGESSWWVKISKAIDKSYFQRVKSEVWSPSRLFMKDIIFTSNRFFKKNPKPSALHAPPVSVFIFWVNPHPGFLFFSFFKKIYLFAFFCVRDGRRGHRFSRISGARGGEPHANGGPCSSPLIGMDKNVRKKKGAAWIAVRPSAHFCFSSGPWSETAFGIWWRLFFFLKARKWVWRREKKRRKV